jgi:autoinducer 2-degrading protein
MYHIASYFDVPRERHQDFIKAALVDARDSCRNEPGTKRFELIRDKDNYNRFYLNEAYEDEQAFLDHCKGKYFKRFFDDIRPYASGPTPLIKGIQIEATAADRASLRPTPLSLGSIMLASPWTV